MKAQLLLSLVAGCGRVAFDPTGAASVDGAPDTGMDLGTMTQPALWFRCNEGAGTTLVNSGTDPEPALLTGGTYEWRSGAIHFTQAYAVTANLSPRYRTFPLTVSMWLTPDIRADSMVTGYGISPFPPNALSNDIEGNGGIGAGLNVWSDGMPGAELRAGWTDVGNPGAFGARRYHVAITYETARMLIYVDGVAGEVELVSYANDALTAPLYIGVHNEDAAYNTKRFFVGEVDDVRVYTSALSATEISALIAAGPQ